MDNCYGEFTNKEEPIELGADITAGSLIKNAGVVWLLPVPISAAEKTWWNAAPMCGLHRALVEKWVPMPLPTVLSSKDSSWHPI